MKPASFQTLFDSPWQQKSQCFFGIISIGFMITSSNGNIFRVTDPLCGELTGPGAVMFSLICAWIDDWVNNREAGDLRRHLGHYDVNVMLSLAIMIHPQGWARLGSERCCLCWYRHDTVLLVLCSKSISHEWDIADGPSMKPLYRLYSDHFVARTANNVISFLSHTTIWKQISDGNKYHPTEQTPKCRQRFNLETPQDLLRSHQPFWIISCMDS